MKHVIRQITQSAEAITNAHPRRRQHAGSQHLLLENNRVIGISGRKDTSRLLKIQQRLGWIESGRWRIARKCKNVVFEERC